MRTIVNSRGMLVGLALLATAGMTACSATRTPGAGGPNNAQTTAPAASAAASEGASPAASAAASRGAPPAAATPGATPTAPGGVQNLVITSAERSQLTAAFVALKGIPLTDVAGADPTPGSVYYAYVPATRTYWALAHFEPSAMAPFDVKVNFQDGGGIGMFQKTGAGAWHVQFGGVPTWCTEPKFFPLAVLAAWSRSAPPGLTC
jgi:hypothetical protein